MQHFLTNAFVFLTSSRRNSHSLCHGWSGGISLYLQTIQAEYQRLRHIHPHLALLECRNGPNQDVYRMSYTPYCRSQCPLRGGGRLARFLRSWKFKVRRKKTIALVIHSMTELIMLIEILWNFAWMGQNKWGK